MDDKKIKQIRVKTSDGKEYTLAYDRKSCARMSRKGFRIDDMKDAPVIAIPLLISGAFIKFHPELTQEQVDAIWSEIKDKETLLRTLMEMYAEPLNALLDEPKDDAKNATWEVVG